MKLLEGLNERQIAVICALGSMDKPATADMLLEEAAYGIDSYSRTRVSGILYSLEQKGIVASTVLGEKKHFHLCVDMDNVYQKWPEYKVR